MSDGISPGQTDFWVARFSQIDQDLGRVKQSRQHSQARWGEKKGFGSLAFEPSPRRESESERNPVQTLAWIGAIGATARNRCQRSGIASRTSSDSCRIVVKPNKARGLSYPLRRHGATISRRSSFVRRCGARSREFRRPVAW